MILHQPVPLLYSVDYHHTPNYNFAYEVNDAHTGDVKSQHEARRGDSVLGQYSLVQPDGVTRTVDYRADEHTGFQATVNNNVRTVEQTTPSEDTRQVNYGIHTAHPWSPPTLSTTPTPTAISRTSLVQSFPIAQGHNPWI